MKLHLAVPIALVLFGTVATPLAAQGRGRGPKRYTIKADQAIVITREVLVKQGFEVDRVQEKGSVITIWYRRGNMGRGRGKGPLQKMVIRKVEDRIVFEETPAAILVDIDVKLRL